METVYTVLENCAKIDWAYKRHIVVKKSLICIHVMPFYNHDFIFVLQFVVIVSRAQLQPKIFLK